MIHDISLLFTVILHIVILSQMLQQLDNRTTTFSQESCTSKAYVTSVIWQGFADWIQKMDGWCNEGK